MKKCPNCGYVQPHKPRILSDREIRARKRQELALALRRQRLTFPEIGKRLPRNESKGVGVDAGYARDLVLSALYREARNSGSSKKESWSYALRQNRALTQIVRSPVAVNGAAIEDLAQIPRKDLAANSLDLPAEEDDFFTFDGEP